MHQTVEDILKLNEKPLITVGPNDTVLDAIQMLSHYDVGALMVFDNKKLVGIFSERDYTRKVMLLKRESNKTLVKEIMSEQVTSIEPDCSLEDCLTMMNNGQFRHLPVMKGGAVMGFISILDVANTLLQQKVHTINSLKTYVSETWPF